MSKVKEQMMIEQEERFKLDLNYQEWLRDNYRRPNELEIIKMAKEMASPKVATEIFWILFAENCIDYNPNIDKGA